VRIAVLGAGVVGSNLGRLWLEHGHDVTFGARDPESDKVKALRQAAGSGLRVDGIAEACEPAEVVVLAVPFAAAPDTLNAAGDLSGKVLVDCTNPLEADLSGLTVGQTTSAAEQVAGWAPGARVVKAFNTIGAQHYANPRFGDQVADAFICGDEGEAKALAGRLAEDLGFEVVDAGSLAAARLLEPLALLWIRMAYVEGAGSNIAFKLLRK
jgi:NADPH-dependent F420 reductase